jgi:hypothetical protein
MKEATRSTNGTNIIKIAKPTRVVGPMMIKRQIVTRVTDRGIDQVK